jgi:hypothetical protein
MLPEQTEVLEMSQNNPPNSSSHLREEGFWTFEAVKERLIDALMLWRRSPGGGKFPYAKDAPWHLMTRKTRMSAAGWKPGRELQLHMQAEDFEEAKRWEGRERRGGLTRDEIARRDEATEWLTWMAEDARRVVILALTQLASGREAVDWRRVKVALGSDDGSAIGNKGVYRRYSRAITAVAVRLNRQPCALDA